MSAATVRSEPVLEAPRPPLRAPAWALVLIGALGAPWLYLGLRALWPVVSEPRPRFGVERRAFPDATRRTWVERGFVQMVPPLRLPSRPDGAEQIEVWVKFPDEGRVGARWLDAQGRFALVYPPGTIADRIELLDGTHVVDVRGTELRPNGELFHVFQPKGDGLAGLSWPRGDADAQDEATRLLVDASRGSARDKESLRINNACAPCHEHAREQRRGSVPARPTDDAGWFVPETVLRDRAPVERHRPREMNVDDPFIRFECATGEGAPTPAKIVERPDGTRWPVCGDQQTAVGVLDVAAALALGDEHARRVCGSRAALRERMDEEARRAFAAAFEVCGIR